MPCSLELKAQAKLLPDSPGIYEFWGQNGELLYIGKSKNIRKRVLSHLSKEYLNDRNVNIAKETALIKAEETAGELGALLLELWRIKNDRPLHNVRSRRTRLLTVLIETEDSRGLKSVEVKRTSSIDPGNYASVLGVFRSVRKAKTHLENVQKEKHLCAKALGLEKGKGGCFYRSLGRCRGVCVGKESVEEHNARLEEAFQTTRIVQWPFSKPVTLKEKRGSRIESFTIDQWCLKDASRKDSGMKTPFFGETTSSFFDYDVYRVLFAFLADRFQEL
jgi:DNA polymerase III subunit epsilon